MSEKTNLVAVAQFISNTPSLRKAVQTKDWPRIATYYNGSDYKKFKYDEQLKTAYLKYAKEGA